MIDIIKIKLKNLQEFVNSEQYLHFENKPISLNRVESYINNPNANGEDIVLYIGLVNKKLIGYRTILSDYFFYEENKQKFGWLSGNWVHPEYRRKQISTKLFNEVYKDWEGNLMYSNYAEESKALYDKTGTFTFLNTLNGFRFYRRFSLAKILPHKHKVFYYLKPLLKITDSFLNVFLDLKPQNKEAFSKGISIEKIDDWNDTVIEFIETFKKEELFKRDATIYQWIKKFPWIKTDKSLQDINTYHFSTFANKFQNDFYKIMSKENIIGIVNISIKENKLKTPYIYCLNEGFIPLKKIILNFCIDHKIDHITIYNKTLNNLLTKEFFIKRRAFKQHFFISRKLLKQFPNMKQNQIQTGDGDTVFT